MNRPKLNRLSMLLCSASIAITLSLGCFTSTAEAGEVIKALGVKFVPVPEKLSTILGIPAGKGVIIGIVTPDSVAAKAGLALGDVLLTFDGQDIDSPAALQLAVKNAHATAKLEIIRGTGHQTLTAQFPSDSVETMTASVVPAPTAVATTLQTAQPDASYVYKPKAPPASAAAAISHSENCRPAKPFDQLVGEKVIFGARAKQFQHFGYNGVTMSSNPVSNATPYADLFGKIGTITQMQASSGNALSDFREVLIKLDGTGDTVKISAFNNHIDYITLLSDIEDGRKRWIGKTLWYRYGGYQTAVDAGPLEFTKSKKFQAVTVTGVVVGGDSGAGNIDFVIQFKDGQEGLAAVSLSASNVDPQMLKLSKEECSFDDAFFTEDPHVTHKWPAKIWDAIENSHALVGMTMEQLEFAWGNPITINETNTSKGSSYQYVYGGSHTRYVYLNDIGIVTSIQE